MRLTERVHDGAARVGTHATRAHEVGVAGLLHHLLDPGRPHDLRGLFAAAGDHLLSIVVQGDGDLVPCDSSVRALRWR